MAPNNKNHKRSDTKDKRRSQAERLNQRAKAQGDEFREDILIESRERSRKDRSNDFDDYELNAPRVAKTRSVQVGTVRGGKLGYTGPNGRTTVAHDVYVKPSAVSWSAYKRTVAVHASNAKSGTVEHARGTARVNSRALLTELQDIVEGLHFNVSVMYVGKASQRKRSQYRAQRQRELSPGSAVIIPDADRVPIVVFPWRYVKIGVTTAELLSQWATIFDVEVDIAKARYDEERASRPPKVTPLAFGDSIPDALNVGIPKAAGIYALFSEFQAEHLPQGVDEYLKLLQDNMPALVAALAECAALTCVDSAKRSQYFVARVISYLAVSPAHRAVVTGLLTKLLTLAPVIALMGILGKGSSSASPPSVTYLGVSDSLTSLMDVIEKARGQLRPNTVVSALIAISGAAWALRSVESLTPPLTSAIFGCISRASGVAGVSTPTGAIQTLLESIPVLFSTIALAIKTRSLQPFFGVKNTNFEDFVLVKTAYDLHKVGSYPNIHFPDAESFIRKVTEVEHAFSLRCSEKDPPKDVLQYRLAVASMYSDVLSDLSGKQRKVPCALALVGASGVGKSTLVQLLLQRVIRSVANQKLAPEQIYTFLNTDKFASGYTMDMLAVILDDLCNPRAATGTAVINPTAIIIDMINNIMVPTNQASVELKGKVFWMMRAVIATSNVMDLGASQYSNEPASILRRFDAMIKVRVKKEFCLKGSVSLDPAKMRSEGITDAWDFYVYRCVPTDSKDNELGYREVKLHKSQYIGIFALMELVERLAKEKDVAQTKLLNRNSVDYSQFSVADLRRHKGVPRIEDGVEEQKVEPLGFSTTLHNVFIPRKVPTVHNRVSVGLLVGAAASFYCGKPMLGSALIVGAGLLRASHLKYEEVRAAKVTRARVLVSVSAASAAFLAWLLLRKKKVSVPRYVGPLGIAEFSNPQLLAPVVPITPNGHQASTTMANLSNIVSSAQRFLTFSSGTSSSIAVATPVMKGVYVLNKHTIFPIMPSLVSTGRASVTMTSVSDKSSQPFLISPEDVLLIPGTDVAFLRCRGRDERDLRDFFLSEEWLRRIGNQPLPITGATACVLRAPDQVKKLQTAPVGNLSILPVQLYGPVEHTLVQFGESTTKMLAFHSLQACKPGDCGSTVVVGIVGAMIAGILSGRIELHEAPKLVFSPVTSEMVAAAVSHFSTVVMLGANPVWGCPEKFAFSEKCHPRLPESVVGMRAMGTLVLASGDSRGVNPKSLNTFRSSLTRSIFMSEMVDDVLGPLGHSFPPPQRDESQFQACIARMGKAPVTIDPLVLEAAEADLSARFCNAAAGRVVKPMSDFAAINGNSECKAIPLNTAAGFGLGGKKSAHMVECCTLECGGRDGCELSHPDPSDDVVPLRINFAPTTELKTRIDELHHALLNRPEHTAVFEAALKDEPVAVGKTKIRTFFVGTVAFNLLVRKYVTPLFLLLQRDRKVSECAVGIDVMSEDWQVLMGDIDAYSTTLRLAGDYSNYDNSIPPEVIALVYRVLHRLAVTLGWSAHDCQMVRGIGIAMQCPTYLFLGAAYQADGTNPSGVAVTSYINSMVNSVVHRVAFYRKNPHLVKLAALTLSNGDTHFTRSVALRTYGDDVVGAPRVVDGVHTLSNHDVRDAAAECSMVYGATQKGSELPEYYRPEDVSFLRCVSQFCPSLNRIVGKVELTSIRKSLGFRRTAAFEAGKNTASSALRLFYPHCDSDEGRVRFSQLRTVLLDALHPEVGNVLRENLLPTFEDLTVSLLAGPTDFAVADGPVEIVW